MDYLRPGFADLRQTMGPDYPRVFLIMGNDDARIFEGGLFEGQDQGLWDYIHGRQVDWLEYTVMGYACIPPSPFLLKDWERYDVSRFVDPGCISPEEGRRTAGPSGREIRFTTMAEELQALAADRTDFSRTILLAHCPPYDCDLDRAALDGKTVDHAPLDVHIGSIATARFIAEHQPLLSLHGHVHESRQLTGNWKINLGSTAAINAATHTTELALVRFDPGDPQSATLELIQPKD